MKKPSLILILLAALAAPLGAQETGSEPVEEEAADTLLEEETAVDESLDANIEALKKEVLSLNRDLFILEEDLLFPANTQFSVFLSMDAGALSPIISTPSVSWRRSSAAGCSACTSAICPPASTKSSRYSPVLAPRAAITAAVRPSRSKRPPNPSSSNS